MENAKDQFGRKDFGKITIRIPTTSSTVLRGQAACRLTQCWADASRKGGKDEHKQYKKF